MTRQSLNRTIACCFLAVITAFAGASADTVFYDDFEDGSATDGSPVTWITGVFPETLFTVSEGDLRVTSSQVGGAGVPAVDILLADTSIRAQVAMEGSGGEGAAVFARGDQATRRSHALEIGIDGTLWLGVASSYVPSITDLRPTENDVVLQIDIIGDMINAWAWTAGESMPSSPLFSVSNSQLSVGSPGVYYGPSDPAQPTPGTAIFRFVHVADTHIPDPTCDFDNNGLCNISDINAMTARGDLVAGVDAPGDQMDLNEDDVINTTDITEWLDQAGPLNGFVGAFKLGDLNLDGLVNGVDFGELGNNWQRGTPAVPPSPDPDLVYTFGDVNGDFKVDSLDFGELGNNWQTVLEPAPAAATSANAVPEPSTAVLCFLGFACLFAWRRMKR